MLRLNVPYEGFKLRKILSHQTYSFLSIGDKAAPAGILLLIRNLSRAFGLDSLFALWKFSVRVVTKNVESHLREIFPAQYDLFCQFMHL